MDTVRPGGGAEQDRAPSAEDAREYVQQVRSLPVEQVIGDVVLSLLNAAQVKLGRRDARLLIDMTTVAVEHARPYMPAELTRQIDQVLGQLRLGQVSAESRASQATEPEDNDLGQVPAPPGGAVQPPAGGVQPPAGPAPSKLWVPGR
ncbi:MAG: hypothetical protein J2P30_21445 [Actinobacteria bacterium]|nr:hypothetical protein [Actinomycetota bacterium]